MKDKLKNLVKKHKIAGKPIGIGKVVGGLAGLVAGGFIGGEIPEFFDTKYSDYILLGVKISPLLILTYLGQKMGGYAGAGYYYINRNGRRNS